MTMIFLSRLTGRRVAALFVFLIGLTAPAVVADDSVKRAAGYQGIWFSLGQYYGRSADDGGYSPSQKTPVFPFGDKYSGGLGTYTAKHVPLAIYVAKVDKTFFVYGGTTGPL